MLKIKCPAIKKGFIIYSGNTHNHIIMANIKEQPNLIYTGIKGFLDNIGKFHTREQAATIAFNSKQIKEKKDKLYSYDLEQKEI